MHGLWPEREDGSYPESCGQGKPYDSSLQTPLLDRLNAFWPSLNGPSDSFWSHEWDKHGRCGTDALPTQPAYFGGALDVLAKYNITVALARHGLFPSNEKQLSLADIDAALVAEYGFTAAFKCDSKQRIETVTQCVDKQLQLRACPDRSSCPAEVWLEEAQLEPHPGPPNRPPAGPSPPPYPPGSGPPQCASFRQVPDGGVFPIADDTWVYALPDDCPSACTVCSAGCLFCASSGYTGAGAPSRALDYDLSDPGSWMGLATSAQCAVGGGIGAVTGGHVSVTGMTGTHSPKTATRVSSAGSTCGIWTAA